MWKFDRFMFIGLLVLGVGLIGCEKKKPAEPAGKESGGHKEAEHATEGPHGGHLVELGNEEYHAELVEDEASHKLTVYILDDHAKDAVPIEQKELTVNATVDGKPKQFKLTAAPQDTDGSGKSSRFEIQDEEFFESVLEQSNSKARLMVTVSGKQFTGELVHEPHGEDGHK